MSGGSWDYVYSRFEDTADRLLMSADARRRAFGRLVGKVAKAMHDIEWVDSSDYGTGDDHAAIDEALGGHYSPALFRELLINAERAHKELGDAIAAAEGAVKSF